ncbi:MAG: type II toxin-antitoxin system PemK/MazF family toxin [Chthoniobacteraceae bacterium]
MGSTTPKRFEIILAGLDPVIGSEMTKTRPAVVVSADEMNAALETVVVCPFTTKLHPKWRSRVQITTKGARAEIAIDQIRTISKQRVIRRLDTLSSKASSEVRRTISEMFGDG